MSEPQQGTVISWTRRFGFIQPDGATDDVFFHLSATVPGEKIKRGDRVVFDTAPDGRKPDRSQAINVRLQERRPCP